jgi:hypothetical protein
LTAAGRRVVADCIRKNEKFAEVQRLFSGAAVAPSRPTLYRWLRDAQHWQEKGVWADEKSGGGSTERSEDGASEDTPRDSGSPALVERVGQRLLLTAAGRRLVAECVRDKLTVAAVVRRLSGGVVKPSRWVVEQWMKAATESLTEKRGRSTHLTAKGLERLATEVAAHAGARRVANVFGVTVATAEKWRADPDNAGAVPEHVDGHRHAWAEEAKNHFSILGKERAKGKKWKPVEEERDAFRMKEWMRHGCMKFCPDCGLQGEQTLKAEWWKKGEAAVRVKCKECDKSLDDLEKEEPAKAQHKAVKDPRPYWTPKAEDWPEELRDLSAEDRRKLMLVHLEVDTKMVKNGKTESRRKAGVIRAKWKKAPVETTVGASGRARRAFDWLMRNNETYRRYEKEQRELARANADATDGKWRTILTAQLLMNMGGIEVAARPWLYPRAACADSDIKERLVQKGQLSWKNLPSIKASFLRKVRSRCRDYGGDWELWCLLHDMAVARQISAVVAIAHRRDIDVSQATSGMQNFESFWKGEEAKLVDMCRQMGEKPSLFFTVAFAEWKACLHEGLLDWWGADYEGGAQAEINMLLRHVGHKVLAEWLLRKGKTDDLIRAAEEKGESAEQWRARRAAGLEEVLEWSFRWEFQKRGTIHVHVVAWARFTTGTPQDLNGRSTRKNYKKGFNENSPLLKLLEKAFNASIDVQCGESEAALLKYVTGYVTKASDAMRWDPKVSDSGPDSNWRTTYRLLCKLSPTLSEMAVAFSMQPLMEASFRGDALHPPTPQVEDARPDPRKNRTRCMYEAYKLRPEDEGGRNFLEWAREWNAEIDAEGTITVKPRGTFHRGVQRDLCALGMLYTFELLDIFVGQWVASRIPHWDEEDIEPDATAPSVAAHLATALKLDRYTKVPDETPVTALLDDIVDDLDVRGLNKARQATFCRRVRAMALLLAKTAEPGAKIPASAWELPMPVPRPPRKWSPEQQEVMDYAEEALSRGDAGAGGHELIHAWMRGGPGCGKTEVVIGVAELCVELGARMLILVPTAAVMEVYRAKLGIVPGIFLETIHAGFAITRDADAHWDPPGRLRHYDVICFDEISQIDDEVAEKLEMGLVELYQGPFVLWTGDEKQLRPVKGGRQLRSWLRALVEEGRCKRVQLEAHEHARSIDPKMLAFLGRARGDQPTKAELIEFFGTRRIAPGRTGRRRKDQQQATREALRFEQQTGRRVTFLTNTNAGAQALSEARCWN